MARITPRSQDYSEWYLDVIREADLADYASVRGCIVVKPYGWSIYEHMRDFLDCRFKETGHVNAAFPLFIPISFLQKEAQHVEGFSPELAVVTHGGGEKLEEALVVRPTSETIIGYSYAQWIKSYRDLPLLINAWNSVVRWERRTKPFIRTMEFYWQEGHTAHATHEEALEEVMRMLNVYYDHMREDCALPGFRGRKSLHERFAGAISTYSVESMMGDKRSLQSCTSHDLGQNFARAFEIKFLDRDNTEKYCWTTSWGLSWRLLGAVIMVHGDDQGLRLPPKIAPYQVVIVPIYKNDAEKSAVFEVADRLLKELKVAGLRVKLDDREETPGFKFNDWEMRGAPVRVEVGPRDVVNGTVGLARRDKPGKEGKSFVAQAGLAAHIHTLLQDIHASLLAQAEQFLHANVRECNTWEEVKEATEDGWALAPLEDNPAHDEFIRNQLTAKTLNFPIEQPEGEWRCVVSGKTARERALIGKSY